MEQTKSPSETYLPWSFVSPSHTVPKLNRKGFQIQQFTCMVTWARVAWYTRIYNPPFQPPLPMRPPNAKCNLIISICEGKSLDHDISSQKILNFNKELSSPLSLWKFQINERMKRTLTAGESRVYILSPRNPQKHFEQVILWILHYRRVSGAGVTHPSQGINSQGCW